LALEVDVGWISDSGTAALTALRRFDGLERRIVLIGVDSVNRIASSLALFVSGASPYPRASEGAASTPARSGTPSRLVLLAAAWPIPSPSVG